MPDKVIIHGSGDGKTIQVEGPGELFLDVDFDDVNHDQVEKDLKRLVALIEKYWDD